MTTRPRSLTGTLLAVGIAAFLAMNLAGVFMYGGMSMEGVSADCPFMADMSMCPMTPLDHASLMQGLFTPGPLQQQLASVLLALGMLVAVAALAWLELGVAPNALAPAALYFHRQRPPSASRIFQELFVRGILNPRTF